MRYETDLGPTKHQKRWMTGQRLLREGIVRIAHVDTGLAPHSVLGFASDGTPPPNIRMDEGRNFHDPAAHSERPVATLRKGRGLVAALTEYPDHGLKTLSLILADSPTATVDGEDRAGLRGVAPGAQVIPYRVANGPVFRDGGGDTAAIGKAIDHALALPDPPRVFSISMGNPGFMGFLEGFRLLLRGETIMAGATRDAIDRAYEAGAIVVCAAGQVIEGTVYPARFARCIAVGGYDRAGATVTHYPRGGYADPQRVDVWARAESINRPSAWLGEDGQPHYGFAVDDGLPEPSGTSYACPQVAAAAAMWVATYHNRLDAAFGDAPWKVTEAFRRALRRSSERVTAQDAAGFGVPGEIAMLDIEALLDTPPEADHTYRKRSSAASAGVW
jgi:subtilisin family serine protease